MKVRTMLYGLTLFIATLITVNFAWAYPTIYPTGVTIYDPYRAYNSYILVPHTTIWENHPSEEIRKIGAKTMTGSVILMDMNGTVVHSWKVTPTSSKRDRLLPNGHLLHIDSTKESQSIIEYDWDNKIVWQWNAPKDLHVHHDVRRLNNGNTLVLAYGEVPEKFMENVVNVTTPWFGVANRKNLKLLGDVIMEVTPKGEIVWEWWAHENLDLNVFNPTADLTDWTHANTISIIPENKWYDSGDKRFKPGNILFNPRHFDKVFLIDKDSKKIVWEWRHDYKGGFANGHEPEMIEKGLPGEGNILVYDNGLFPKDRLRAGQAFLLEVNPISKQVVWKYEETNQRFFSRTRSTQKRLPNGNTFTDEDDTGRIFQVTPKGEIVWEYVHSTIIYRPAPYAYDYCPQLKAMPKPPQDQVTPPNNLEWKLLPDKFRK